MKFTPMPSMSPRLLSQEQISTDTPGYAVWLELIDDPKDGNMHLLVGVGGKRVQSARLNIEQAFVLVRKLQSLVTTL